MFANCFLFRYLRFWVDGCPTSPFNAPPRSPASAQPIGKFPGVARLLVLVWNMTGEERIILPDRQVTIAPDSYYLIAPQQKSRVIHHLAIKCLLSCTSLDRPKPPAISIDQFTWANAVRRNCQPSLALASSEPLPTPGCGGPGGTSDLTGSCHHACSTHQPTNHNGISAALRNVGQNVIPEPIGVNDMAQQVALSRARFSVPTATNAAMARAPSCGANG